MPRRGLPLLPHSAVSMVQLDPAAESHAAADIGGDESEELQVAFAFTSSMYRLVSSSRDAPTPAAS